MLKSERFSTYSHLFVAILALIGLIFILMLTRSDPLHQFIFGLAVSMAIFSMGSSALYHSKKQEENELNWRRKLDHIAIFFIIAGFFTALSYMYLPYPWNWIIICIEWAFVIAGFILKIFYMNAPRWMTSIVYMVMGLVAIIPLPIYYGDMSPIGRLLLILGGIVLLCGGTIYALKWPDPKPGVFGFHDIFHIFIGIGLILYYFVLYDIVINLNG